MSLNFEDLKNCGWQTDKWPLRVNFTEMYKRSIDEIESSFKKLQMSTMS